MAAGPARRRDRILLYRIVSCNKKETLFFRESKVKEKLYGTYIQVLRSLFDISYYSYLYNLYVVQVIRYGWKYLFLPSTGTMDKSITNSGTSTCTCTKKGIV